MKQVLSVADFAIILDLVQTRINSMEQLPVIFHNVTKEEHKKMEKEHLERVRENTYYKSLKHIMESLQNLNIEVETPDVEVVENDNQN